jgi:hypothetical protein
VLHKLELVTAMVSFINQHLAILLLSFFEDVAASLPLLSGYYPALSA